jgi:hypothetical protein
MVRLHWHTPMTDPIAVCLSTCRAFQDREKSPTSPSLRLCQDGHIIVETTNCQNWIRFHITYNIVYDIDTISEIFKWYSMIRYSIRYRARYSLYTGAVNEHHNGNRNLVGTDFDFGIWKDTDPFASPVTRLLPGDPYTCEMRSAGDRPVRPAQIEKLNIVHDIVSDIVCDHL